MKPCLRCDEAFKSAGKHNRLCKKCEAWSESEDCPYSEGNYLYAVSGDDAETIQAKRKLNTLAATHLRRQ